VKQSHKTLLLWVLLILMFVAIYHLVSDPDQTQSVAFSDFLNDVRNGHVEQVTIRQRDNSAEYKYIVSADDTRLK
jgi:cell division protease FtsH